MTRGARAMAGHPLLGYILATVGLLNGAWYGVFYLCLPLLIQRHGVMGPGGSGLGAFGCVISAYGCTNVAATVFFGGRSLSDRPQFQMFSGELVVGTGLGLLALGKLSAAGMDSAGADGRGGVRRGGRPDEGYPCCRSPADAAETRGYGSWHAGPYGGQQRRHAGRHGRRPRGPPCIRYCSGGRDLRRDHLRTRRHRARSLCALDRDERDQSPQSCVDGLPRRCRGSCMSRIVVIGNAGGGKSTLARLLAQRRGLPHIEIDRLLWQEGWCAYAHGRL